MIKALVLALLNFVGADAEVGQEGGLSAWVFCENPTGYRRIERSFENINISNCVRESDEPAVPFHKGISIFHSPGSADCNVASFSRSQIGVSFPGAASIPLKCQGATITNLRVIQVEKDNVRECRGNSRVFYLKVDCERKIGPVFSLNRFLRDIPDFRPQISSSLRLANSRGFSSHTLSGLQGAPDKEDTKKSNYREPNRGNEHPERPRSHILLSLQIIFGLLYAAISAYIVGQTSKPVDKSAFLHDGPAGSWAMLGGIGLILGGGCALIGLVLLIG